MCGSVAITANDCRAGQRETLFRSDDVDDALTLVIHFEILDAERLGIIVKRLHLDAALFVFDAFGAVSGRHIVVSNRQRLLRRVHLAACQAQTLKGLRACHFMDEMAVDVEKAGAVLFHFDQMSIPDFIVHGARCSHFHSPVFPPMRSVKRGARRSQM